MGIIQPRLSTGTVRLTTSLPFYVETLRNTLFTGLNAAFGDQKMLPGGRFHVAGAIDDESNATLHAYIRNLDDDGARRFLACNTILEAMSSIRPGVIELFSRTTDWTLCHTGQFVAQLAKAGCQIASKVPLYRWIHELGHDQVDTLSSEYLVECTADQAWITMRDQGAAEATGLPCGERVAIDNIDVLTHMIGMRAVHPTLNLMAENYQGKPGSVIHLEGWLKIQQSTDSQATPGDYLLSLDTQAYHRNLFARETCDLCHAWSEELQPVCEGFNQAIATGDDIRDVLTRIITDGFQLGLQCLNNVIDLEVMLQHVGTEARLNIPENYTISRLDIGQDEATYYVEQSEEVAA
ncbi:MAG: hypothetical protein ACOCXA_00285 [Planctomycetota bacterium]